MKTNGRTVAFAMALGDQAMGRRIAQARERARLTQEAAADRAGVTLRAYQKWEAGGGIQYANLGRVAAALSTTVEEITGKAETPNPFRVVDEIDERLTEIETEFRRHVASMLATEQRIEDKLDRQYRILGEILEALGTPDPVERIRRAGQAIAALAPETPRVPAEPRAVPRGSRGRRADG